MTAKDWEQILNHAGDGDIFTADDYNEDYAIELSLTVKEIRTIHLILKHTEKLFKLVKDQRVPKYLIHERKFS